MIDHTTTVASSERRSKRSDDRWEALQYLVEALADRSEAKAVVLIDESGRIMAGMGMAKDIVGLAKLARPVCRGEVCAELEAVTAGTDLFARVVPVVQRGSEKTIYLAALGTKLRKMNDAVVGITRILQ